MLVLFLFFCLFSNSSYAQHPYDPNSCHSTTLHPGSRYACNSFTNSCQTFIVYRARPHYQTILQISNLFGIKTDDLLLLNNFTSSSQSLATGTDVVIPISCFCAGEFFQANSTYTILNGSSYSEIACEAFAGLVKSSTLIDENSFPVNFLPVGGELHVPLTCACPDDLNNGNGINYLVSYPIVEGDGTITISKKFGVLPEELWAENSLPPRPTVFPSTTILVPLREKPVIFSVASSSPIPGFLPTVERRKKTSLSNLYVVLLVFGILFVVLALLAGGFYLKSLRKYKGERLDSFTPRSSPTTCLSPDILSMFKYTVYTYTFEELKAATNDFCEESRICRSLYKGSLDELNIMIQHMKYEESRRIIDIYSKINHVNIVQLLGLCYTESNGSRSYLVFEFASNGCLRDCLSSKSNPLDWRKRTQIAFDIAMGLNYLHHCTSPSYVHMNINARNVLITEDWKAKIANFGSTTLTGSVKRKGDTQSQWVAPEYLLHGSVSAKVDTFAFGVVLFELISAQDTTDGKLFNDSINFLGGEGGESGYLDQFRSLVDPYLKDNYPIAEALCLAVLAKACVEDDPLHRPSMNDIIKIISRMV